MEFFKCNETYFCNVTTHFKSFGICPQFTDFQTYPCDVRSCKPYFEPIPGYWQEIDCYFKGEPDPKPNGNGLTIALSCGFGFLLVVTTFGYLYKKGLIRKGWSQLKNINFRGFVEAFWRNIKSCFKQPAKKYILVFWIYSDLVLKDLNGASKMFNAAKYVWGWLSIVFIMYFVVIKITILKKDVIWLKSIDWILCQ